MKEPISVNINNLSLCTYIYNKLKSGIDDCTFMIYAQQKKQFFAEILYMKQLFSASSDSKFFVTIFAGLLPTSLGDYHFNVPLVTDVNSPG